MKLECHEKNCVHCVADNMKLGDPLVASYHCEKSQDAKVFFDSNPDNCPYYTEADSLVTNDQRNNKLNGICLSCVNKDGLRNLCVSHLRPKMRIRNGATFECDRYKPVEVPVKKDMVNHPNHYQGDIEVIDYIRDKLTHTGFTDYCCGNVLKYVSRWRKKDGVQDLRKAKVYLEWMIESADKEEHLNVT